VDRLLELAQDQPVEQVPVDAAMTGRCPQRPRVTLTFDQVVEYIGKDEEQLHLFHGHPGRVFDVSRVDDGDISVSFVNGPSTACRPHELAPLPETEYLRRGRRLVELRHPLDDRRVRGLCLPGQEWPEGAQPASQ